MRLVQIALVLLSVPALASTDNVRGQYTGTTAWTVSGSPYNVTGDVIIPAGSTLSIEPGVVVNVSPSDASMAGSDTTKAELIIDGQLTIAATSANPVTFTSTGTWVGLRITGGTGTSIAGANIQKAVYGIDTAVSISVSDTQISNTTTGCYRATNGTLTLSGSSATGCGSYGVIASSTAIVNVDHTVLSQSSYGLYYGAGGTAHHNTLTGNSSYGVYVYSTAAIAIRDSIITSNGSYGIYVSSGSPTVDHNDVWGQSSNVYNTSNTNGLTANPLFVGGANYRITSSSPARKADSTGSGDLGALPYVSDPTATLEGTIYASQTLSGTQTVTGDLTVAAGATLTLSPGTTLTFAGTDAMSSGTDTTKCELIVNGTLVVQASQANPVVMTSGGTWEGIRILGGTGTSLAGLRISNAVYGIDTQVSATVSDTQVLSATTGCYRTTAGTLTLSGSLGQTCGSYGVIASSTGTANVDTTVLTGSSYGMYFGSGGTAGHVTVTGNSSYGVYVYTSSPVTVRDSILTSNGSYGIYVSSGTPTVDHNDIWGQSSNVYNTSNTNGLTTNPLFVGGSNYRITSNSPARKADSVGADLGALPFGSDATPTLTGTLFSNQTLTGNQTVTGDLTVAAGVTLTLAPGATLTFAGNDQMAAGSDTTRSELIVNGTLASTASQTNPVVLTSGGTWVGVRLTGGSSTQVSGLRISNAVYGLDTAVSATVSDTQVLNATTGCYRVTSGTLSMTGSSGSACGSYGLISSAAGNANVDHSIFTGASYGIYFGSGGSTHHNTVTGNSSYGVYVYTSSPVTVRDSIITSNGSYGIYVSSGSPTVDHNDIWAQSSNVYNTTNTLGLTANPLFAGGSNDRITSNSPARKADSTGGDLGALPYVSDVTPALEGTLFVNQTLTGPNTVVGDLTVAPGVTVTLAPGASLTFAGNDAMAAGSDTTRSELIVNGTLVAQASQANPVVLTSSGTWVGVRITGGTGTSLAGLRISNAVYGVDAAVSAQVSDTLVNNATTGCYRTTGGTLTVTGSTGATCGSYGAIASSTGTLNIDHTVLTGSSYGLYFGSGGSATHDTVTANSSYGAYVYTSQPVIIRDSILSSNGSYGVYVSSGTPTVDHDDIWGQSSNVYNTTNTTGLTTDPMFVSSSDYHLQSPSPCRGAGTMSTDLGAFPFSVGTVDHVTISPTTPNVGAGGTVSFSAQAYDAANNPVPGQTYQFSALAAAGSLANSQLTASCTPGTIANAVTVTVAGKSATASVTIGAGAAASVSVSPTTMSVAAGGNASFTATVKDACNNPLSTGTVTWTAGAGSMDQTGHYTAPCSPGSYVKAVSATVGSFTGTADVTVGAGVLARISVSPANPSLPAGGQAQFSAAGADGCGNAVPATVTWSASNGGNINASTGLFTAGAAPGTWATAITATSGGNTGTTGVTVVAGSISSVTISPPSVTLAPGATQMFSAAARDNNGNVVAVPLTWTVVSGGGTIDATGKLTAGNTAGTFNGTIRATAAGVSGSANLTVSVGPASQIVLSPGSATLAPGGTTSFSGQAKDAFGNPTADTLTWAVSPAAAGTITQGGVFTASGQLGSYPNAVTATAGAAMASASITIQAGALSQLLVMPGSATVRAGGTVAFTASGRDVNGNVVAVTPSWIVVHGGGTINASGIFTASTTPGMYLDTVQALANGLSATATLIVTTGPIVQVALNPAYPVLEPGQTVPFTTKASDSFGNEVTGVSIDWTVDPAAGAIDLHGNFTAGTTEDDFPNAVTATAQGISGTASVRIGHGAPQLDGGMDSDGGTGLLPDGGTMGGSSYMAEPTCGCSGSPVGLLALLGLVPLARRRRR